MDNDTGGPGGASGRPRLRARRLANLKRLFRPRSIAFIGGRSVEPSLRMARKAGFDGVLRVVNPRYGEIGGIPCHRSIADLPEPPDAAFLYVGREMTADVVRALAERGAGGAICYAAGFGELGEDGRIYQEGLAAAVGDLALLGPNANGMINTLDGVALWPVESHEPRRYERGVAVITQSGTVAFNYVNDRRSVHPSHIVSIGNQAFIDAADIMDVLLDDGRVAAIGLFLEGIPDVPRFSQAAVKAIERNVPIVVMKVGRTETGARMALTHTGSLAGGDDFHQALFDRLGIVRVATLDALDETLKMIAVAGCPGGRNIVGVTMCGAFRTMFGDAASDNRLTFPDLPEATASSLRAQLPRFAVASNPLDYNAPYTGMEGLSLENYPALLRCFETALETPHDIAAMIDNFDMGVTADGEIDSKPFRAWMNAAAPPGTKRVLISGLSDRLSAPFREACIRHGIAPLQGIDDGAKAIASAAWIAERRAEILAEGRPEGLVLPRIETLGEHARLLDEDAGKSALAAYGLVVPERRVVDLYGVAAAAADIGFPVVIKAINADVAHKSRMGGVKVGMRDAAEARAAAADITARFGARGLRIDGFLVERMIANGEAELIAGIVRDERFGLGFVLGPGGVRVEALRGTELILLPALAGDLDRFCRRVATRLGLEDISLSALQQAARAIAGYAADHQHSLLELDVNPLIVSGRRVVAVDAVIRLALPATGSERSPP